ncbi:MAG: hypothetical protein F8N35_12965 [Paludibacter sp.]|nr:hypothetical protein [Paludibacter sp.]
MSPFIIPMVLQQIEHGTLALMAQFRAFGHSIRGIVQPHLWQYDMIGDAGNLTDGLVYNPNLKPFQKDGFTSGTMDDRWAFTSHSPMGDVGSATALAAASRALKSYNDSLSSECLATAQKVWNDNVLNKQETPVETDIPDFSPAFMRSMSVGQEATLTIELLLATKDKKYSDFLAKIWPEVKKSLGGGSQRMSFGASSVRTLLKAIPFMGEEYKNDLRAIAQNTKKELDALIAKNPYGVPLGQGGFYSPGSNFSIVDWSLNNAKLYQYFPDIISKEYAIRGLNYILGCHPASSISFVSGVGVNSKRVTYGNNRADFTSIPGGMVPGNYLIKPDFYENKEDWPFIWYENEVVVDGCAGYIYLAALVDHLLQQ